MVVYIKLKASRLSAFPWCMSQTSRDRVNSRRVRTHKKNSGDAVRRLATIIQSIFCAQSGANIRLTVWKWSGESRYPGAFPPVLENFLHAFSPARLTAPGSPRMMLTERRRFSCICRPSSLICCLLFTKILKMVPYYTWTIYYPLRIIVHLIPVVVV